jgi:glycosyltransferase involved in cell wall biosynthesis
MRKPNADSKTALLLAAEAPYPAIGGGALRTASLAEYLGRRYTLDVIVFRQPGNPHPAVYFPPGLARRIETIDLPYHGRSITARLWRNLGRLLRAAPPLNDRFAGFQQQLAALTAGNHYDVGVVEHFWCAPYAAQLQRCCDRLMLDLHNIESHLYSTMAGVEGWLERIVFQRFANASRDLERRWIPLYTLVLTPCDNEAQEVAAVAPNSRAVVYPNSIPASAVPDIQAGDSIVFSGNLEYRPNIGAVRFFHDSIWPLIVSKRPSLRWRLVGMNPHAVRPILNGDPRIELVGQVDDSLRALAASKVAVVPVLSGSGTRVKIIEAWAAGVPVVATSLGAAGLDAMPGRHLLIADSPQAFAAAVLSLLSDATLHARLRSAARELYEQRFTWNAAWRCLEQAGV